MGNTKDQKILVKMKEASEKKVDVVASFLADTLIQTLIEEGSDEKSGDLHKSELNKTAR